VLQAQTSNQGPMIRRAREAFVVATGGLRLNVYDGNSLVYSTRRAQNSEMSI
jgi:hypothetical protein